VNPENCKPVTLRPTQGKILEKFMKGIFVIMETVITRSQCEFIEEKVMPDTFISLVFN
jgi:hypothetical protein